MQFFENMVKNGALDLKKPWHIRILQLCFGPLIRYDLANIQKEWNEYTIR